MLHPHIKGEITMTAAAAIKAADRTTNGFKEFTWRENTIMAQVILQMIGGTKAVEAIKLLDSASELGEAAKEAIYLHEDEPIDGLIGIVLALVLELR